MGSCVSRPDILPSYMENKLQETITRVFTNIPFSKFISLWENRGNLIDNNLVITYVMRNFLLLVENKYKNDESEILAQALNFFHKKKNLIFILIFAKIDVNFLNLAMVDLEVLEDQEDQKDQKDQIHNIVRLCKNN
jgi:hypothetical protein